MFYYENNENRKWEFSLLIILFLIHHAKADTAYRYWYTKEDWQSARENTEYDSIIWESNRWWE